MVNQNNNLHMKSKLMGLKNESVTVLRLISYLASSNSQNLLKVRYITEM